MKLKNVCILLLVVFAVFALQGVGYAVNRVEVKVTSEPVPPESNCDKAGGWTLGFDSNTVIQHGDRLYFDLDDDGDSGPVTLCTDIDFVLSPVANATLDGSEPNSGWGVNPGAAVLFDRIPTPTQSGTTIISPVINAEEDDGVGNTGPLQVTNGGVFFHVYGTKGERRVWIDVIGEFVPGDTRTPALQVGRDPSDALFLSFLDQATNPGQNGARRYTPDHVGLWIDPDGDGEYDTAGSIEDNTLCVDVENYNPLKGQANIDEVTDKFTFIPSNPQVFHSGSGAQLIQVPCEKPTCGYIEIGEMEEQGLAETCDAFDNETGAGYCTINTIHDDNEIIVRQPNGFDSSVQYRVQIDVRVNQNVTPNQGVYWTSTGVGIRGYNSQPNCNSLTTDPTMFVADPTGYIYYDALERPIANYTAAPNVNDCTVGTGQRATRVVSQAFTFAAGDEYLYIDLPPLNYNLENIDDGDYVEVKVTLIRLPCGQQTIDWHCVGTFGCNPPEITRQLFFPYFARWDADGAYTNGFAVDNLGDLDGTATVWVYEEDGDVGMATIQVPAMGMWSGVLASLLPNINLEEGDGELGDSGAYVVLCANFDADGFAFMFNNDTGASMGYIPRINPGLQFPFPGRDSYDLCPDEN